DRPRAGGPGTGRGSPPRQRPRLALPACPGVLGHARACLASRAGGGSDMRVLVVEDSVKMATLLRKGLEREGYAVDVASSGQDAIWLASENDYDAIVLDVILDTAEAGPDGFEVCQDIRAFGCQAPVLMVTARDAVEDRVRGLDTGADDYLPKP